LIIAGGQQSCLRSFIYLITGFLQVKYAFMNTAPFFTFGYRHAIFLYTKFLKNMMMLNKGKHNVG